MAEASGTRRINGWWAYWCFTTLGCSALATVVDAILLQRKWNYLTGGFLARDYAATWAERTGFFAGSFLADFSVFSIVVTVSLWLALLFRFRARQAVLLAVAAALVPFALMEFINYRLAAYLGDSGDLRLLFDLSGRNVREFLAVSTTKSVEVIWIGVGTALTGVWAIWVVARGLTRHLWARTVGFVNPHGVRALIASSSLLVIASVVVVVLRGASDAIDNGLKRKPSVDALSYVISTISDVDGDGYGILGRISDSAPMDSRIHPFALDVPGNGIDEDGVGGDLPADSPTYLEPPLPLTPSARKPPVVFILLESVRDDAVGSVLNGRSVTPVLDELAKTGVRARAAYSHNGFTVQSRKHLFSGSTAGIHGRTSLIDDFKARGYEVAYFSGQDDSFGGADGDSGFSRADVFYDARSDVRRRYTVSTTPGSLAVPSEVVLENVSTFLAGRSSSKPLFLYVNFHDTHYPYHHSSVRSLLPTPVLEQSDIGPSSSNELRRMYANTLANVDQAVGTLLERVRASVGHDLGVIVTSDHGESLFDDGVLGHGYLLDDVQTRVPLIVTGLPVVVREPWGQSDLRNMLALALSGSNSGQQPMVVHDPDRAVFQYLGLVEGPAQIGSIDRQGRLTYDFRSRRVGVDSEPAVRPDRLSSSEQDRFLRLIRTWEGMMWARAREHGANEAD